MDLIWLLLSIEAVVIFAIAIVGTLAIRRQGKINEKLADDHRMLTCAVLRQSDSELAKEFSELVESSAA